MNDYSINNSGRRKTIITLIVVAVMILLVGASVTVVRTVYYDNFEPVSTSEKSQLVTVAIGSTPGQIAEQLEKAGLIRKAWVFEWYVRNSGARDKLQAGTYALRPSQDVREIVSVLTRGKVATDLVTIFPARRIDEVRDDLVNQGFAAEAVDAALNPALYSDHPALVDKPADTNLEGYLFPESFQKTATTTAEEIIRASLNQMHEQLTPEIRAGIVRQGLNVHEGIILASIVEQEVGSKDPVKDLDDKKKVAQVFLRRLKEGIALESDATAGYGAVLVGEDPSISYSSPYNTYQNKGLTPSPISNVGLNSLRSVAEPATTTYLFFVSGDDGTNYFSHTIEEHRRFTREHCSTCP